MSERVFCYLCGEDGKQKMIADLHWHGFGVHIECLAVVRARAMDAEESLRRLQKENGRLRNAFDEMAENRNNTPNKFYSIFDRARIAEGKTPHVTRRCTSVGTLSESVSRDGSIEDR